MGAHRRGLWVTLIGSLLLTLVATVTVRGAEVRDDRARFDSVTTTVGVMIERELLRLLDLGVAAEAALATTGGVDPVGYARILDRLGVPERYPALLGVSLIEVVDRDDLEQRVLERQAQGPFEVVSDAGEESIRLLTYVHPVVANEPALGIDLNLLMTSLEAHEAAIAAGEPRLSHATQLVQLAEDEPGAVLHVPTTVPGTDRPATLGMVIAGQRFLDELAPFPADVGVVVEDRDSEVFPTVGVVGDPGPGGLTASRTMEVAGETWELRVLAPASFALPLLQRGSTYLGIGGVLASILLGLLVHGASTRERYAVELAAARTEELARVNDQLAAASQAKDEFLASVSHELRTPLTVIAGFADLLHKADPEQRTDRLIVPIDRNVRRLSALVEDLLTLASIDAGAAAYLPDTVDLAGVLTSAPTMLAGLPPEDVEVDVEPGLAAEVDPRHLERMLINLLSNAGRHGRPPIELTAEVLPTDVSRVRIVVRDHGPGVAPPALDELFSRFARGRDERRSSGTGLGLAIVRELVELNHGTLHHESASPGARFVITLPRAASAG